ncbi:SPFH domain-containing protein [Ruminococcus sp. 2227st1_E6_2227SCRN_220401]|uniref:flotillin family protein n=1 Tax=unclassified Ruminococcus TaxID=2608920 RepID=UPI00319EA783
MPIIIIPIIVIIVLLVLGYTKAPPNKAAVITGLRDKPKVLLGKAGFKIPFLERVDWMGVGQIDIDIETEDYIPTKDFINIKVDAIAQVAVDITPDGMEIAMRNFLNKKAEAVKETISKSLQGNLREIIGTMELKDICQNKTEFSEQVKANAEGDIAQLGIRILSFNVQNIQDKDGLIDDLGIDNREQIRKSASIAKANAEKEVAIAQAQADNDANIEKVKARTAIAERENELAIKQSSLKMTEDTAKAKADAAYKIQEESSRKEIEVYTQEADIAKREKEIELQAKEAEVAEKKLDAEVRKKAEAEKYAEMQKADADLYKRQKDAEAKLFEQEKEAAAIRKQGEAEAEAIRQKGLAEAEALDKKAEAMAKYGQAAILEMLVGVLPDMAKAVAEPISAIDKVTVIGGDSNGVSDMAGNVPTVLAKVMESVKEATGVDMAEIIKANTYDAKVNRNVNISGLKMEIPESNSTETEE